MSLTAAAYPATDPATLPPQPVGAVCVNAVVELADRMMPAGGELFGIEVPAGAGRTEALEELGLALWRANAAAAAAPAPTAFTYEPTDGDHARQWFELAQLSGSLQGNREAYRALGWLHRAARSHALANLPSVADTTPEHERVPGGADQGGRRDD